MTSYDNTYGAFMLDYIAGSLSPAERLAADLHRVLSRSGERNACALEAVGGALLEQVLPASGGYFDITKLGLQDEAEPGEAGLGEGGPADARLDPFINGDLMALNWRKSVFGVMTLPTPTPNATLLRLDPGRRAPAHGHGRRDVTVVLRGAFADHYGVYERGDLAFAEPGVKHEPRAVGEETCICLLAAEPGNGLQDFLGYLGLMGRKRNETA